MVKLALLRLRILSVLAPLPLLFAAMSYSYSGNDLTGQRLALHHLQDEKKVIPNIEGSDPDAKEGKQKGETEKAPRTEKPPPTAQAQ